MPGYQGRRKALALSMVAALAMIAGAVDARAGEADLYLFGELFTWKEFESDNTQILKENGPLYGAGYYGHFEIGEDDNAGYEYEKGAAVTISPRIELFGGKIDLTGEQCDLSGTCAPAESETGHAGGKIELDLGVADGNALRLEIFVGAGVRGWVRTINEDQDRPGGSQLEEYAERWISTYGRAGMRAYVPFFESSRFFLEATVKKPFSNSKTVYISDISDFLDDVKVNPGEKSSVFYEVGLKLAAFKISAFYETLHYSESEHVLTYSAFLGTTLETWQPKSKAEMYGARIGVSF